jgi:hypothetical protein
MTAAQSRLAETLGTFYNAADRTSEGAMAAHAYKQSVDDLDQGIGRELVRCNVGRSNTSNPSNFIGCTISNNDPGAVRQDECLFSNHQ